MVWTVWKLYFQVLAMSFSEMSALIIAQNFSLFPFKKENFLQKWC